METVSLWKISWALVALSSLWLIYSVWFFLLNYRWPAWNQARADKRWKAAWNCQSKGFFSYFPFKFSFALCILYEFSRASQPLWKISRALVALSSLWLIYSVWFILLNYRWPTWNQARADKRWKAAWNCQSKGFFSYFPFKFSFALCILYEFSRVSKCQTKIATKNRLYIVTYRVQFGKFAKTSTFRA